MLDAPINAKSQQYKLYKKRLLVYTYCWFFVFAKNIKTNKERYNPTLGMGTKFTPKAHFTSFFKKQPI